MPGPRPARQQQYGKAALDPGTALELTRDELRCDLGIARQTSGRRRLGRNDRLVYEEYFTGTDRRPGPDGRLSTLELTFGPDTLHDVRSVGKSVTSALAGIALASGAIASIDTPLVDFFPDHAHLMTPELRRITLRHALTMSAGLAWNEEDVPYTDPANDREQMYASTDPVGYVLSRRSVAAPGGIRYYNTGLPLLLGLAISRASGRTFGAYAREMLFDPLEIRRVEWSKHQTWRTLPELTWNGSEGWGRVAHPGGL